MPKKKSRGFEFKNTSPEIKRLIKSGMVYLKYHQGHHPVECSGSNPVCSKTACGQDEFSDALYEAKKKGM